MSSTEQQKQLQQLQMASQQLQLQQKMQETIQHLNRIKACETYYVKTKGLVESDLESIERILMRH